jgi:hypothetical protein
VLSPDEIKEKVVRYEGKKIATSRFGLMIVGALVVAAIIATLVGASLWQNSVSDSRQNDADAHTANATLLQAAGSEGGAAAELLRTYVQNGDETLIPQIQSHASTGVEKLTGAVTGGGSLELRQIAVSGAGLAEGAGRVISLRRQGDVAGAATSLQLMAPDFQALTQGLQKSAQQELNQAASLQNSADSAADIASWLRVAAMAVATVAGLAIFASITRHFLARKASGVGSTA